MKRPDAAPLINVEEIKDEQLAQGTIEQTDFEEVYDESIAEMSQGFSTGMNYINLFRIETRKSFENRMEKTEKSIESLLKILAEKK